MLWHYSLPPEVKLLLLLLQPTCIKLLSIVWIGRVTVSTATFLRILGVEDFYVSAKSFVGWVVSVYLVAPVSLFSNTLILLILLVLIILMRILHYEHGFSLPLGRFRISSGISSLSPLLLLQTHTANLRWLLITHSHLFNLRCYVLG
jgi:hypothetical protein